jgi:hypothetical protein
VTRTPLYGAAAMPALLAWRRDDVAMESISRFAAAVATTRVCQPSC